MTHTCHCMHYVIEYFGKSALSRQFPEMIVWSKFRTDADQMTHLIRSANQRTSFQHQLEIRRFCRNNPKYEFSHDFIGEFFATVNSLAKDYKNATIFPCINEKKRKKKGSKYKNSGVVRHDSKKCYVILRWALRNINNDDGITTHFGHPRLDRPHLCRPRSVISINLIRNIVIT